MSRVKPPPPPDPACKAVDNQAWCEFHGAYKRFYHRRVKDREREARRPRPVRHPRPDRPGGGLLPTRTIEAPPGGPGRLADATSRAAEQAERLAAEGRRLWAELHTFAARWDGNRQAAEAFLADFTRRVPAGGCGCRESWREALAADPPDLSDARSMMAWSIRVHNRINRKLGKTEMDEATTRRRWDAGGTAP